MKKSVFPCPHRLVLLPLLGLMGCYSSVTEDSSAEKAIAIDWVDPPCAEPGSEAGYIEGNGFGAENVTVTVGGVGAEVLAATGMDASFVVPEGLAPGPVVVVVENPGGRIATIDWVVCGPGPDVDPPELVDFDFNPKQIDVSTQDQQVNVTLSATDVGSGTQVVSVTFRSPSGSQGRGCGASTNPPSSGDRFDGTWTSQCTFPALSEPGTWVVESVRLQDLFNAATYTTSDLQALGFPTQLEVTSSGPDTDPPELVDFDFNPKQVDVSVQDQVVPCTTTVTDVSGVTNVTCSVVSPSGSQITQCGSTTPVLGDEFNGTYECDLTIPMSAEPGAWSINFVRLDDAPGNDVFYTTTQLQALGFPTQLEVTSSGPDTDPPELVDFDFNPKQVDVSVQDQVVPCTTTVTDVSGVTNVTCSVVSPSGSQITQCGSTTPVLGDEFNGTYECDLTIPMSAEPGAWSINFVRLDDAPGNDVFYTTTQLQALGFPTQLEVTSATPDVDPPELVDFDFNPKQVDVSVQDQVVPCTTTVTDVSGVTNVTCSVVSPSGSQITQCGSTTPVLGDEFNGTYECDLTIPMSAEPGAWSINFVRLDDAPGNDVFYTTTQLQALGFPTQLEVTSSGPDTDPPVLTDFDFNPKQIDVSTQDEQVNVTLSGTDIGSGIQVVSVTFRSPSGSQGRGCGASTNPPSSGDRFDGTWTSQCTFPALSEPGTWVVESVRLQDLFNAATYSTADLQVLGFPTELEVTSAAPDTDPPVLTDFDFNPKQIDVSTQDQQVNVTLSATDVGSGTQVVSVTFRSPSGSQGRGCGASTNPPTSGDRFDGTWTSQCTFPALSEPGTWVVESVRLQDLFNAATYSTADLQVLGFPTELEVTYGP